MRLLGVDYGLRRIGLAVGETESCMAFALNPLKGTGKTDADAAAVASLLRQEECEAAVIGLPLLLAGEEGEQARITRSFGDALEREGVSVTYWDERFSSAAAERALSYLSPKKRKTVADSEAARQILAEYLANAAS